MTENLLKDEKVIWSGKPVRASFVFSAINAQMVFGAFLTIAFFAVMMSLFFLVSGGSEPASLIFYLFAWWFVLLGAVG